MPLKILHTADVHLGAKFLGLGRKGEYQRTQLLQAFDDTVNLAIRERVNMMLIAGDLFDSASVSRSLLGRVALKHTAIDPASFTTIRLVSGAVALWLIRRVVPVWVSRRKMSQCPLPSPDTSPGDALWNTT